MTPSGPVGGDHGLLELPDRPARPPWSRLKWFFTGKRPEPEPSYIGTIEGPDATAVGICCSGGGIRSAAYNLGALQALQSHEQVRPAKYIAAVSGGSYIAASWCMVAQTGPADSDPLAVTDADPPFRPGSPEEQYLRNRSSYLAPTGMAKLFMGYRILMGLVFNLLFLSLFLFALGVGLAWALFGREYGGKMTAAHGRQNFAIDVPDGVWKLLIVLAAAVLAAGGVILLRRIREDDRRSALETWSSRLIVATGIAVLLLVVTPSLAVVALNAWHGNGNDAPPQGTGAALGAGSFGTLLLAVALQLRAAVNEPAKALKKLTGARAAFAKLGKRLRHALVYVAGTVAGPLLLLLILVASSAVALSFWDGTHPSGLILTIAGGALAGFLALYALADLNTWSLHPFYRRRLASAFALKRVLDENGRAVCEERPYDDLVRLSESRLPADWPMLIVCAAANVSDPGATPPGRGVTSFTFSPNAIGGPLVRAASVTAYEGALGANRDRDITLPAAVAMSGAALSPSMGKLTRKPLVFLMALANVRLGVWVPNPARIEGWKQRWAVRDEEKAVDVWKRPRPKFMLRELFGVNRIGSRFLYVSDGGHYENLGLVELLRRGCGLIYCFDASGGESFETLGDAIALARSELGVEIEIDPRKLVPKGKRSLAEKACVSGSIRYRDGTMGKLVYARTVVTNDVAWDVHAYHEKDTTFPHTSTAEQLYTDQRFEAYRELGWHAGECAFAEMREAIAARDGDAPPPVKPNGDRILARADVGSYHVELSQHPNDS